VFDKMTARTALAPGMDDRDDRTHEGWSPSVVAEAIRGSMDRWDLSTRVQERTGDLLSVQPGRPVELSGPPGYGLTRLGFRMLTAESQIAPVVGVDVRGWMSPQAAWEAGVVREHLVLVRCSDPKLWPRVTAALIGVRPADLRRLTALARARQMRLVLRPISEGLPSGVAHLRLRAMGVAWEGPDRGHGRLGTRKLVLEASGKGASGMVQRIEVEDEGEDALRVVSGLAAGPSRRAVG
jgi:hypothetical protein